MDQGAEKIAWRNVPWSEEALEHLSAILKHDTCGGLCSLEEIVQGAVLFEGELRGEIVGRYALTIMQHVHGVEAVIVAAAGHAPGEDLTAHGLADALSASTWTRSWFTRGGSRSYASSRARASPATRSCCAKN
jgi:hypothetical protein